MKTKNLILAILAGLSISLTSCNIGDLNNNREPGLGENNNVDNSGEIIDDALHKFYEAAIISNKFKGTFDEWINFISGQSGDMNINKFTKEEILKAEYQKAVDSGNYNGTYEEWLNFIRGENINQIDPNASLKDAYNKAVASGNFIGTYEEWLSLIKGENGELGVLKPVDKDSILKAEYQKAIDSGNYNGTYEEWLKFITGKDGVLNPAPVDQNEALKSLYNKAINSGNFTGTYDEWIKRVSGENGSLMPVTPSDPEIKLKDAYNKAISSGNYRGTYVEWLAFVKGENGPLIKEETTYNLTINFNNGKPSEVRTYHENELIDLQNPSKDEYKFINWTDANGNIVNFPMNIYSNIEVTANYQRNYAEVTFMHKGQVFESTKYNVGYELEFLPLERDLNLEPNESLLHWYYLDNEQEMIVNTPFKLYEPKDYVFYSKIDTFNPNTVDQNLKADITYFTSIYSDPETKELEDKISKFNAIYPNINVNYVKSGRAHDIYKSIKSLYLRNEELPNIYDSYNGLANELDENLNSSLDISLYEGDSRYGLGTKFENGTSVLDKETQSSNINYFTTSNGGRSYRPYNNNGYFWYVNQSEINESHPVRNISQALEKARSLKAKYPERYPDNKTAPIAIPDLVSIFENNDRNGDFSFKIGSLLDKCSINNVDVKAKIKEYKSYYDEGLFLTNELRRQNGGTRYIEDDFTKDNPSTFMLYETTKGIKYLIVKPKMVDQDMVSTNTLTRINYIDGSLYEASPNVLGFFKHSENENIASWLFYKFLLTYKPATYDFSNLRYPFIKTYYNNNIAYDNLMKYNKPIEITDDYNTRLNKLMAQTANEMKGSVNGYSLHCKYSTVTKSHFESLFEDMICDVFNAKTDNFDLYLSNALDKLENDMNDYYSTYTF